MGVIIKDIKKNNNEIIRVEVSEFQEKELINIRIWFQAMDQNTGEVIFKPTQKGVALQLSEFAELQDAVNRLANYIKDKDTGNMPEQFSGEKAKEETK